MMSNRPPRQPAVPPLQAQCLICGTWFDATIESLRKPEPVQTCGRSCAARLAAERRERRRDAASVEHLQIMLWRMRAIVEWLQRVKGNVAWTDPRLRKDLQALEVHVAEWAGQLMEADLARRAGEGARNAERGADGPGDQLAGNGSRGRPGVTFNAFP